MFAHEIVGKIGMPQFVTEKILNSQIFHIGHMDDLKSVKETVFNSTNGGILVELKQQIVNDLNSLPYQNTIITCYGRAIPKRMLLCFNASNDRMVFNINPGFDSIGLFVFHNIDSLWRASPIFILVCPTDRPMPSPLYFNQVFLKNAFSLHEGIWALNLSPGERYTDERLSYNAGNLIVLYTFLQLLACKNITTKENHPDKALNKARIKRGKLPLFTYKTLVIKPTTKKQESQQVQGLWDNRVHLCRGHFKNYTEANPLFGRITGRYWWQPCVRGRNKKGVVMKDYEVQTND